MFQHVIGIFHTLRQRVSHKNVRKNPRRLKKEGENSAGRREDMKCQ